MFLFPHNRINLPIQLLSAGVAMERSPGYSWKGLSRGIDDFVLFQYTLSGFGLLRYENYEAEVPPGKAMVLHFPHDNHYRVAEGGHWEFFFICIKGLDAVSIWREVQQTHGPVISFSPDSPCLRNFGQLCMDALTLNWKTPWIPSDRSWSAAMALMEHTRNPFSGDGKSDSQGPIEAAMEFARTNYAQSVGVEEMARAAGLSRYHFSRRFRTTTGCTPGEYLIRLRLEKAVALLQKPGKLLIKEIATACGFSDSNYFCRRFREHFGVAPGEFRRSGIIGRDQAGVK